MNFPPPMPPPAPPAAPPARPLLVEGTPDPTPSRALWIVKWLLLIPHYIVLFVLWVAVVPVSVIAFFAILVNGRYPRGLFDFTVGVLRWNWRVTYYGYGVLATDRYPPFTLGEAPDYPARLRVAYPEHLSRGLVLVKWWLLAIPHYLVLAAFSGAGVYSAHASSGWRSPGLMGAVVLIVVFALLFTGRYPRGLFHLLMGLNRWSLRVSAYVLLLTDVYPPFRLDQGPMEPEL
ncbi:DUF4389 domain-containing protein [Actinomadura rupiterrae]|uniref:DUF4389 domain-containing protein n=1 Tax=Actinomadura rupiterrae TaxID=559627 RepID=UPI0020A23F93|nr:DUF4389 domain-containing protein [Actinomadura rupiterrae]MCP2343807.1 hypothetical protein [Actinomadura rupiterrae]